MGQKGVKKDWNLFFNTLFWNLNFWDNVSTVAGEVDKPQKNFPLALLVAVIFTCVSYLIPLFAVTGAVSVDQSEWESGFHAIAAEMIAGKWLKVWIEVGAVLSAIGLFEAQLSSSAYQVLGMADIGILPEFFAVRSKWFGTPWVGILLSSLISIGVSYMDFTDIVSSANFLYSLGMLLEFAAFIWLRRKLPSLKRPYRVPLVVPGLVAGFNGMFLAYVMWRGRLVPRLIPAIGFVGVPLILLSATATIFGLWGQTSTAGALSELKVSFFILVIEILELLGELIADGLQRIFEAGLHGMHSVFDRGDDRVLRRKLRPPGRLVVVAVLLLEGQLFLRLSTIFRLRPLIKCQFFYDLIILLIFVLLSRRLEFGSIFLKLCKFRWWPLKQIVLDALSVLHHLYHRTTTSNAYLRALTTWQGHLTDFASR